MLVKSVKRDFKDATAKQIDRIVKRGIAGGRGRIWTGRKSIKRDKNGDGILYTATLKFTKTGGRKDAEPKQWLEICKAVYSAAQSAANGGWSVVGGEDNSEIPAVHVTGGSKGYGAIDLDLSDFDALYEKHYSHIYNRKDHIFRLLRALKTAQDTELEKRFNAVLHGPPGSGKSEILKATIEMVGEENVFQLDATSMTAAGAYKKIFEADVIPPILAIEEMEKREEKELRWLIGLTDTSGRIQKTNFRMDETRHVRMLCISTVNNMDLFSNILSGAIASRFSGNRIYCGHPDRDTMRQILLRDVHRYAEAGFKEEWIDHALDFGMEELKITDPREVLPICLCGQDALLDGSYQRAIIGTMSPDELHRVEESVLEKYREG